jgi:hypothetical protein
MGNAPEVGPSLPLGRSRPVRHTVGVCWCDLGHFECLLPCRRRPRRTTSPVVVMRRRRERRRFTAPSVGRKARRARLVLNCRVSHRTPRQASATSADSDGIQRGRV